MLSFTPAVALCVCGATALFAVLWFPARWGSRKCPPGPTGLPLIGNLLQLPTEHQHEVFAKWTLKYGDLIHVRMFRTHLLIVSSARIAQDLMAKRSSIYSGRLRSTLYTELLPWDASLPLMTYDDRFKRQRRWIHDAFQTKSSLASYRHMQRREVDILVAGLVKAPQELLAHVHRFTSALVIEPSFGHTVTSMDDDYVRVVEEAMKATSATGLPGSVLVDFIPVLKYIPSWMPGAGFKRRANVARFLISRMFDVTYDSVADAMNSGTAQPSFTASLIEQASSDGGPTPEDIIEIKGAAGGLYGAGQVTTLSVMYSIALLMLLYPEVQKKAQHEIDLVVGNQRLPGFDDRESLPYLECVLRELYRWSCPLPLGIPHLTTADDEYCGYHIEKGSVVTPNIWAMTRNTELYPDPEEFRPERFENMAMETADFRDPRNLIFGFGRRTCPGLQFADANIWLALANILAVLDIRKARDASGEEITPVVAFTSGFERHVAPFQFDISARASDRR